METAVVRQPALPAQPVAADFTARLVNLPLRSKASLALGLAALAAVVLSLTLWTGQGDYKVLYANLSDKDGGAIIAQLAQMNVPYRHADGGAAILVPASQVHDARLKLASVGLPKGSVVGFELMDSARFGLTQFGERLNFQRGLEGELTRSITALAAVQAARVHLALPNQNGFFREQQKPSASVVLTLYPGRTLDRTQIAGIVHLVASSVAELAPKNVSVLDQTGTLLSGGGDAAATSGLDAQQLQYVSQVEQGMTRRIFDLLEPVVGRDNLRASVTAELDFSQSESTSELFTPNQGPQADRAVRSQQSSEVGTSGAAQPAGVPGAASNQPPQQATAPINGAAAPLQSAQTGGASGNLRRDSVTNYEVDKTVRVTRNATGSVKRLNAAVVVNNRSVTDAKGKTTTQPLGAEEIAKLTALVKESIGFNAERGDSVKVINAPFRVEPQTSVELPMWKQPETLDLVRTLAVPGALAAVALLVFLGLVRPALRALQSAAAAPGPGQRLHAVANDALPLPEQESTALAVLEAPRSSAHLEQARALAKQNPAAVAGIVRDWVASGQAA
ncbi:MAG TPA: flagellar basal-body MS-ring/collar protein FliF [Burkholderiaceae bacterium]|nr:flagellar basal-body MS-ring/collar protein FliF [Burkholderiaceae bacterium]